MIIFFIIIVIWNWFRSDKHWLTITVNNPKLIEFNQFDLPDGHPFLFKWALSVWKSEVIMSNSALSPFAVNNVEILENFKKALDTWNISSLIFNCRKLSDTISVSFFKY